MTDHDPLLDELASAHLDGTTSAEEAAQVLADPALRARVDELRAIRAAVGAVPEIDPDRRETAIAAALAAFDEPPDRGHAPTPGVAPVTSLAAVAARRRSSPTALRLVGVAAALLLLALLVPLVAGLGGGSDDDEASETATAFDDGGEDATIAEGGAGDAALESATDATSTTSARSAEPVELGRFDDLAALVDAVEQEAAAGGFEPLAPLAETTSESAGGASCATAGSPGSTTATATLDGAAVLVVVTTGADDVRTLRILAAETCTLLVERPL